MALCLPPFTTGGVCQALVNKLLPCSLFRLLIASQNLSHPPHSTPPLQASWKLPRPPSCSRRSRRWTARPTCRVWTWWTLMPSSCRLQLLWCAAKPRCEAAAGSTLWAAVAVAGCAASSHAMRQLAEQVTGLGRGRRRVLWCATCAHRLGQSQGSARPGHSQPGVWCRPGKPGSGVGPGLEQPQQGKAAACHWP